jgi:hypothetical protein
MQINSDTPNACGLKAGLRTALFIVSGRRRYGDMNDYLKLPVAIAIPNENRAWGMGTPLSDAI